MKYQQNVQVVIASTDGIDCDSFFSRVPSNVPDHSGFDGRVEERLTILRGPDEVNPDA
jgi:hypothetical protein